MGWATITVSISKISETVANKNTILEINGRQYDARTGTVLGSSTAAVHNLDGIVMGKRDHGEVALQQRQSLPPAPIQKPSLQDVVRGPAKALNPHKPQTAQTLMRTVVKKPHVTAKRTSAARSSLVPQAAQAAQVSITKTAAHRIDQRRHQKAQRIPQSAAIQRFIKTAPGAVSVPLAPPAPFKPVAQAATPMPPQEPQSPTAALLERALAAASTEVAAPVHPKRLLSVKRQVGAISLTVIAASLLLGVVASQNMNGLRLQLASSKAGFSAGLPTHTPSGYHLANLNYQSGLVSAYYKSNVRDSRAFSLTEKTSDWDSAVLLDDYIRQADPNYQTTQLSGRTIYLYDNGQASWVNGGIWYVVSSNGNLSNPQLLQLASNL